MHSTTIRLAVFTRELQRVVIMFFCITSSYRHFIKTCGSHSALETLFFILKNDHIIYVRNIIQMEQL